MLSNGSTCCGTKTRHNVEHTWRVASLENKKKRMETDMKKKSSFSNGINIQHDNLFLSKEIIFLFLKIDLNFFSDDQSICTLNEGDLSYKSKMKTSCY